MEKWAKLNQSPPTPFIVNFNPIVALGSVLPTGAELIPFVPYDELTICFCGNDNVNVYRQQWLSMVNRCRLKQYRLSLGLSGK